MFKLKLIFSKNEKIGSKLISWFSELLLEGKLEKFPSHVAVLVEREGVEPTVWESTLDSGVRRIPYEEWKLHVEECYSFDYPDADEAFFWEHVGLTAGKKYDYMGILYFVYAYLRHKIFGIEIPKVNAWEQEDRYFCTELAANLITYENYSMTTPAKMCYDLKKKKEQK